MNSSTTELRVGGRIDTYTGKKFEVLDPRPCDIDIRDIAHALSLLCRFNGQSLFFYSVAQHCISVSKEMRNAGYSERYQLYGLLHDAAEAYMCDLPKPIKEFLPEYKIVELDLARVIFKGLILVEPSIEIINVIRKFDNLMLATEAKVLMKNFNITVPEGCDLLHTEIAYKPMHEVEVEFLDLYNKLIAQIG